MGGAIGGTALGVGYLVKKNSPRVQLRPVLGSGHWYVLVRSSGSTWAEVVAETKTEEMANAIRQHLLRGKR